MSEWIPYDPGLDAPVVPAGLASEIPEHTGRAGLVHDDGILRITRTIAPPGYAVSGEIDAATHDGLVAALCRLDRDADVYLDLSGLVFCDAAGLAAMVGLVDRAGAGCRVVLDGLPAPLAKLLSIVGWESLPNLEIHPRPD